MYTALHAEMPQQQWQAYYHFSQQMVAHNKHVHVFYHPNFNTFRAKIAQIKHALEVFLFFKGSNCVGIFEHLRTGNYAYCAFLPNAINSQHTNANTNIDRAFRQLLTNELGLAGKKIRISCSQEAVSKWLVRLGGQLSIHDFIQELHFKQLNQQLVKALLQSSEHSLKQYDLSYDITGYLTTKWMDEYIGFHNEIIPDILVHDMENGEQPISKALLLERYAVLKKQGTDMVYVLVYNQQQQLVGCTEVLLQHNPNTTEAHSGLTAVKKSYRKRQIATFLKAKMITHLTAQYPNVTVLNTYNSAINTPILSLNKKLGFQKLCEEFMVDFDTGQQTTNGTTT